MIEQRYIDGILEATDEDLAVKFGAQLLAVQLKRALRAYRGATVAAHEYRETLTGMLPEAERIGILVLKAQAEGRKTVRVSDLVDPAAGKAAA